MASPSLRPGTADGLAFAREDLDVGEAEAVKLGAHRAEVQPRPDRWRVLLDPAGHPFCLVADAPLVPLGPRSGRPETP
jgi:hypothetical protein